jgi:hypothetical protein
VNVKDKGLINAIVGNRCIVIIVALGKGLIVAIVANSLLIVVIGNVALLDIL